MKITNGATITKPKLCFCVLTALFFFLFEIPVKCPSYHTFMNYNYKYNQFDFELFGVICL